MDVQLGKWHDFAGFSQPWLKHWGKHSPFLPSPPLALAAAHWITQGREQKSISCLAHCSAGVGNTLIPVKGNSLPQHQRGIQVRHTQVMNMLLKPYPCSFPSSKQPCNSEALVRTNSSLLCSYIRHFILLQDVSPCSWHQGHVSIFSSLPQLEIHVCLQKFIIHLFQVFQHHQSFIYIVFISWSRSRHSLRLV